MQTVTSHVQSDGTAAITCPVCSSQKRASVASLKNKKHVLNVRCRCKTVFKVLLNYRRHYRKAVNLSGTYKTLYQYEKRKGLAQIANISAGGLQYRVVGLNKLLPGSIVNLDFELDDRKRSSINKQALVCYVDSNIVGCEFVDQGDPDRALAFYLRV